MRDEKYGNLVRALSMSLAAGPRTLAFQRTLALEVPSRLLGAAPLDVAVLLSRFLKHAHKIDKIFFILSGVACRAPLALRLLVRFATHAAARRAVQSPDAPFTMRLVQSDVYDAVVHR